MALKLLFNFSKDSSKKRDMYIKSENIIALPGNDIIYLQKPFKFYFLEYRNNRFGKVKPSDINSDCSSYEWYFLLT